MDLDQIYWWLGLIVVSTPGILLAVIGVPCLLHRPLSEAAVSRWTYSTIAAGLLASLAILGLMLWSGDRHVPVELGDWIVIPEEHFHFTLKFVFDRLSVPFAILTLVLCGTIGAFASNYLHREAGYHRFFILYALFLCGMIFSTTAGTIETLFAGWELVGLSSAFLVAYFQNRAAPVRNGLRVWIVYRIADAAFLIAAVTMHHFSGGGDFEGLMGSGAWPEGKAALTPDQALFIGLFMLLAAAGKSALVPFSGWLPRAMEGPTPSSAVFYGSLSVHLGAFLLLRISPILELSPLLAGCVVAIGLTTAIFGVMVERVQADIKSSLAFASMTQVGIIVAEIGFGLRYIALVHIIGHACLRTLQLLRAPSLLKDYHMLENAIGERLPQTGSRIGALFPKWLATRMYRLALERGYLDAYLTAYIVQPFIRVFEFCDRQERRWNDWLSGANPVEHESADYVVKQTQELA